MWDFSITLRRSQTIVMSVKLSLTVEKGMRTGEKATKPSTAQIHLLRTNESSLEKDFMSAANVEKPVLEDVTSFSTHGFDSSASVALPFEFRTGLQVF